ncbi:MAG TPA: helix-turn-helix transcriptional regulator [Thermomicrobiales bacterium]|nr:helix-turn-helix transcriptional regulator [Thermomicrobiales bacterium]
MTHKSTPKETPRIETPLARRVRTRREDMGLTQVEVSQAVGMSQEWTSMLERGRIRQPRISALQKLADVLDIPVEEMLMLAGMSKTVTDARAMTSEAVALVDRLSSLSSESIRKLDSIAEGLQLMEEADKAAKESPARRTSGSRR